MNKQRKVSAISFLCLFHLIKCNFYLVLFPNIILIAEHNIIRLFRIIYQKSEIIFCGAARFFIYFKYYFLLNFI